MTKDTKLSTARFKGSVKPISKDELAEIGISKSSLISEASSLIPDSFDVDRNIDILPVVFNLALVNKFNANGDGIDTKTALSIIKGFVHKPINIEHKKNLIVGHMINASFSDKEPDFQENDLVDFAYRTDPFYITVAAVIYKHIYPELAEALENASDPENPLYKAYASSWEIGFNDFKISVGSENLEESDVYEKGSEEFDEAKNHLQAFGGSGKNFAGQVNRLLCGEVFALGSALTEDPAAGVEGVFTLLEEKTEKAIAEKVSQKENEDVIVNEFNNYSNKKMDEKQFKELKELLEAAMKSDASVSEANTAMKQISDALAESGSEWQSKSEKADLDLKESKDEIATIKDELSKASEELDALKQTALAKEVVDTFNARMKRVEELYTFDEAVAKFVAQEVSGLESEEKAFDDYLEKAAIVYAHFNQKAIADAKELSDASSKEDKEDKEEESDASKKEGDDKEDKEDKSEKDELELGEKSKASVTNNNGGDHKEESLAERVRKAGLEVED